MRAVHAARILQLNQPRMTASIGWKVARRILLEFGPPVAIGAAWVWWNYAANQSTADSVKNFSAGFVVIAFVWASLLRIHHQQSTRVQQDQIAGGMQGVDTAVKDIGAEINTVKETLASLVSKLEHFNQGKKLTDEDTVEISNLVRTANNHIQSANTKFDSFRLNAEGQLKAPSRPKS